MQQAAALWGRRRICCRMEGDGLTQRSERKLQSCKPYGASAAPQCQPSQSHPPGSTGTRHVVRARLLALELRVRKLQIVTASSRLAPYIPPKNPNIVAETPNFASSSCSPMASSAPTLLLLLLGFLVFTAKAGPGGRLGGKTEIEDVKRNEEVQALGRYCVEEEQGRGRKGALSFTEVTEAQKQVVAGTKYYLRISAAEDGVRKSFDAVVVVKPWLRSKQLVSFAPSNSDR